MKDIQFGELATYSGVDVPAWVDQEITIFGILKIAEEGCGLGSIYSAKVMSKHVIKVMGYLAARLPDNAPVPRLEDFHSYYLNLATEMWAKEAWAEIEGEGVPNDK